MATYFTDDGKRLDVNDTEVPGIEKPWCVVIDPGSDDEMVWSDHITFGAALKVKGMFGKSAVVDVMKRRADGSLTTEF